MPYRCDTWDWERDGWKAGPRPAPAWDKRMSYKGRALGLEMHKGLWHRRRIEILTRLVVTGGRATVDLANEMGMALGHLGIVLRGLRVAGLAEKYPARRLVPHDGKWRSGRWGSVWCVTESGRWNLWRAAWIARVAFSDPAEPLPWHPDGLEDAVEAVKRDVQGDLLTPKGMVVARGLMGHITSGHRIVRENWLADGDVSVRIRRWIRRGWIEQYPDYLTVPFQGKQWPHVEMNEAGYRGIWLHIDALRRAAVAGRWTPTPDCVEYAPWDGDGWPQTWLEREFVESGWVL